MRTVPTVLFIPLHRRLVSDERYKKAVVLGAFEWPISAAHSNVLTHCSQPCAPHPHTALQPHARLRLRDRRGTGHASTPEVTTVKCEHRLSPQALHSRQKSPGC